MEPIGTMGAITLLGQNDCTPQSVVKALDNFLRAVQQMREVVMVPSRLKDMKFVSHLCMTDTKARVKKSHEFQCPVKENGKTSKALSPSWNANSSGINEISAKMDLFSFYSMLYSIRNELVCGSESSSEMIFGSGTSSSLLEQAAMVVDENQIVDEQAARLAHAFRQHMQGLFTILGQFTEAANYLSKKYQDEFDIKKQ